MRLGIFSLILVLTSTSWAATGVAELRATSIGAPLKGTIHFMDTPTGLEIKAQISSAPPGLHGFHIHEYGGCDDLGKAAGGHYNPKGTPHGMIMKDGMEHAHAGDMGNVTVDAKGEATLSMTIPGVTLTGGDHSVAGRAVILHEKADDFGQPVGNAGGRIGCGPILITGN